MDPALREVFIALRFGIQFADAKGQEGAGGKQVDTHLVDAAFFHREREAAAHGYQQPDRHAVGKKPGKAEQARSQQRRTAQQQQQHQGNV